MKDDIALIIALASFVVSGITLWLNQLRRGRLAMTQPSMLVLMREPPDNRPKIFLRTLLFCTGARGCVIENIYATMTQEIGNYVFDFWAYGEANRLLIGSGLFVGQTGVAYNHHFLLRHGTPDFCFWNGVYRIEIFAKVVGRRDVIRLQEFTIELPSVAAAHMAQLTDAATSFEWQADTQRYVGHVERRPDAMMSPG